jgi:hypothetical protein
MMESDVEALVKERPPEAIPAAVPPPIFHMRLTAITLLFDGFYLPRPSRGKISGVIYMFYVKTCHHSKD